MGNLSHHTCWVRVQCSLTDCKVNNNNNKHNNFKKILYHKFRLQWHSYDFILEGEGVDIFFNKCQVGL